MSTGVGARLVEYDVNLSRWLRYPFLITKTLAVFIKERPQVVFAQNPSLILAFLAVIYGRLFRVRTVVDAHNAGIFPLEGKSSMLNRLADVLLRWTDLTIVTNKSLAERVHSSGGKAFVMPDPMPEVASSFKVPKLKGAYNILFVCSWSSDEPYLNVLRAARKIDNDICIYITGNSRGKEESLGEDMSSNVNLTGFIPEDEYLSLVNACDAVMVLTTREDCLVCGAYEAVAAGKPLILSGSAALKHYFNSGCVYTTNEIEDIAASIATVRENNEGLGGEIHLLHEEKLKDNSRLLIQLKDEITASL
jgi:glycosyltransferase involved in cell wall biosynthesis